MLCNNSLCAVWLAQTYCLLGMLHCAAPPEGLNHAFTFSLFGPALLANDIKLHGKRCRDYSSRQSLLHSSPCLWLSLTQDVGLHIANTIETELSLHLNLNTRITKLSIGWHFLSSWDSLLLLQTNPQQLMLFRHEVHLNKIQKFSYDWSKIQRFFITKIEWLPLTLLKVVW
jgi:hypothetical protein